MGTTYEEIYQTGAKHFKDREFFLYDDDIKEEVMFGHLKSAISDFIHACKNDLDDRNDEAQQFTATLTNEEKEILGLGIAYYWQLSQTLDADAYKLIPSTKDYIYSSPATLLGSVGDRTDKLEKRFNQRIVNYTYLNANISGSGQGG